MPADLRKFRRLKLNPAGDLSSVAIYAPYVTAPLLRATFLDHHNATRCMAGYKDLLDLTSSKRRVSLEAKHTSRSGWRPDDSVQDIRSMIMYVMSSES